MIPVHPMLVHLPLGLALAAPILGLWYAFRRAEMGRPFGVFLVAWQVLLSVAIYAATVTGEHEEKVAEKVVKKEFIAAHENAGNLLLLASIACIPAAAIAARKDRASFSLLLVAAQVVVLGLAVRTGFLGGGLVYEHGAASAYQKEPGAKLEDKH